MALGQVSKILYHPCVDKKAMFKILPSFLSSVLAMHWPDQHVGWFRTLIDSHPRN